MEKSVFVLVVLLAVAVRQTIGTPSKGNIFGGLGPLADLSTWKPLCLGDRSIYLPINAKFKDFSVAVVPFPNATACKEGPYTDLDRHHRIIPQGCFPDPNSYVILKIQHKEGVQTFTGGRDYKELYLSCELDGQGHLQPVTANLIVQTPTEKIPLQFQDISLDLKLVSWPGTEASSVSLGQDNIFLQVKHTVSANDHYVLAPISCTGKNDQGAETYTFFLASNSSCSYDSEVMDPFTVNYPVATDEDITSAPFYPFKFTTGDKVTLTCQILVCPSATTPAPTDYCSQVVNQLTPACKSQSPLTTPIPSTTPMTTAMPNPPPAPGRRRRAAGGQETHTRVLEVTYSVLDPGPVLQGPTAGAAGAAISVPLLAAVASLWML